MEKVLRRRLRNPIMCPSFKLKIQRMKKKYQDSKTEEYSMVEKIQKFRDRIFEHRKNNSIQQLIIGFRDRKITRIDIFILFLLFYLKVGTYLLALDKFCLF